MSDITSTFAIDSSSSHVAIEIDRARLRNYLRTSKILVWTLSLSIYAALMGSCLSISHVQRGRFSWFESIWIIARGTGMMVGAAVLIGLVTYLIFNHRQSRQSAESLEVSVEGAFLRIRQEGWIRSDRKIPFRSMMDFACRQDLLMRFTGIHSLRITITTVGAGSRNFVTILGVKDCIKVRDMLSEIDPSREIR